MASLRLGRRSAQIIAKNSALFLCDMQLRFEPSVKYFKEVVAVSNKLLRVAMEMDIPTIVTEQYPKGLGPTTPALGIEEFNLKAIPKTCFTMLVPEVESMLKARPNVNSVILCGIETHACIQATAMSLLEKNFDVYVIKDACSSRSLADSFCHILVATMGPTIPTLGIHEFNLKPIQKTSASMLVPTVESFLKSKPNVNSIILCGIETHACVQATAMSLLEKNYDVYVIKDACSSRRLEDRNTAFDLMRDCGAFLTTSESITINLLQDTTHPKFKLVKKHIQESSPDTGI